MIISYPSDVFWWTYFNGVFMSRKSHNNCFGSRSLFSILLGLPLSSKHSCLEYCHLRLTTFSLSLVFTSLVTDKSDLNCSTSFFKSESSFLIPARECVKFSLIIQNKTGDFIFVYLFGCRCRKCHDNKNKQILITYCKIRQLRRCFNCSDLLVGWLCSFHLASPLRLVSPMKRDHQWNVNIKNNHFDR